jgi:hypothetical protein
VAGDFCCYLARFPRWLDSPVGRRVAGLVATGLLPSLALLLGFALADLLVTLLVMLLVAVLVWPVAIVSWLGRVGPASRAG